MDLLLPAEKNRKGKGSFLRFLFFTYIRDWLILKLTETVRHRCPGKMRNTLKAQAVATEKATNTQAWNVLCEQSDKTSWAQRGE